MTFAADVLNTLSMIVAPVPGKFTLKKENNYFYADRDNRSIRLPCKPYLAIRIQRAN